MPILNHLTSANDVASIRRTGIKAVSSGRGTPRGVFCMPWLPNDFASHQWLRELKRRGQRMVVAVDFRLPSDEPVWVGRYHQEHRGMRLGRAIGMLLREVDARGFEVVVPRSIRPDEIIRVRTPSQILGWRYSLDAHGRRPTCACRVCLPKGMFKSRRLRQRLDPTGELY